MNTKASNFEDVQKSKPYWIENTNSPVYIKTYMRFESDFDYINEFFHEHHNTHI